MLILVLYVSHNEFFCYNFKTIKSTFNLIWIVLCNCMTSTSQAVDMSFLTVDMIIRLNN